MRDDFFKLCLTTGIYALCVGFLWQVEDWAKCIGYAIILAGYVAHEYAR